MPIEGRPRGPRRHAGRAAASAGFNPPTRTAPRTPCESARSCGSAGPGQPAAGPPARGRRAASYSRSWISCRCSAAPSSTCVAQALIRSTRSGPPAASRIMAGVAALQAPTCRGLRSRVARPGPRPRRAPRSSCCLARAGRLGHRSAGWGPTCIGWSATAPACLRIYDREACHQSGGASLAPPSTRFALSTKAAVRLQAPCSRQRASFAQRHTG